MLKEDRKQIAEKHNSALVDFQQVSAEKLTEEDWFPHIYEFADAVGSSLDALVEALHLHFGQTFANVPPLYLDERAGDKLGRKGRRRLNLKATQDAVDRSEDGVKREVVQAVIDLREVMDGSAKRVETLGVVAEGRGNQSKETIPRFREYSPHQYADQRPAQPRSKACFECGFIGHLWRNCPYSQASLRMGGAQDQRGMDSQDRDFYEPSPTWPATPYKYSERAPRRGGARSTGPFRSRSGRVIDDIQKHTDKTRGHDQVLIEGDTNISSKQIVECLDLSISDS